MISGKQLTRKQQKIISQVHDFVKKKSKQFGKEDAFKNHILGVRDFAILLAKKYKINPFIVTISAYLHDLYFIMTENHKIHEIKGSQFARKYLKQFNIPKEEIELIAKCVLNHRGSKQRKRNSLEEKIIACADAMDHIARCQYLFYRVSKEWGFGSEETIKWMAAKLKRGWEKIALKKGREIVKDKYAAARKIFEIN